MNGDTSPRTIARLTAIFYLITIAGGVFAQGIVSDKLVDFKNAGTTAANILANETLYRTAFSVFLIEMTCQIITSVLFYQLLKPVNRNVALVATAISLGASIIKTTARTFFIAPLAVLHSDALGAFSADQINALSLILLRIDNRGPQIALAMFGPSTLLTGWLMYKSTFFPKWLGVLGIAGGLLWSTWYWPPLGSKLFMVAAVFALASVIAICAYMLIYGVNEARWREQASMAAASIWR